MSPTSLPTTARPAAVQRKTRPGPSAPGESRRSALLRGVEGFAAQEAALAPVAAEEPTEVEGLEGLGIPAIGVEREAPGSPDGEATGPVGGEAAGPVGGAPGGGAGDEAGPVARLAGRGELTIGAPDGALERQADAVAERALKRPALALDGARGAGPGPKAEGAAAVCPECGGAKKAASAGACPECSAAGGGATPGIQRKAAGSGPAPVIPASAIPVPDAGEPLAANVRDRVEPVLGADLGHVRVHQGPVARQDADAIQAKAFTHGSHIWLGSGESASDVGLMAHEAAHVVQQAGGGTPGAQRKPAVQRSLAEKVVPDWVLARIHQARDRVAAAGPEMLQGAREVVESGQSQAEQAASEGEAQAESVETQGESQAEQLAAEGEGQVGQAKGAGETALAQGDAQAQEVNRHGEAAPDNLDPGVVALQGGAVPPPAGAAEAESEAAPAAGPGAEAEGEGMLPSAPAIPDAGGEAALGEASASVDQVAKAAEEAHGGEGWDCSEKQIVAAISRVKEEALDGMVTMVSRSRGGRLLVAFASALGIDLDKVAQSIKQGVAAGIEGAKARIAARIEEVRETVAKVGATVEEAWSSAKERIGEKWQEYKERQAKRWDAIKEWVDDKVGDRVRAIRGGAERVAGAARQAATKFWPYLPAALKAAVGQPAARLAAAASAAYKVGGAVVSKVAQHKDKLMALGRRALDVVAQRAAKRWNKLKAAGGLVVDLLAQRAQQRYQHYKGIADQLGLSVDGLKDTRAGEAARVAKKLTKEAAGQACAALDKTAGPCVERFVPKPEGDGEGDNESSGFAKLAGKGDLNVVAYGVPIKLGAGYRCEVTRTPGRVYTVTIAGEGSAEVNFEKKGGAWGMAGGGGGPGSVSLEGTLSHRARALMKLAGQGPPTEQTDTREGSKGEPGSSDGGEATKSPTETPTQQSDGPSEQGGAGGVGSSGPKKSAKAGLKGSFVLTYAFDAAGDASTCDGLGGLAGFLAGQGMQVSLGSPYDALARGVSAVAFEDRLQSARMILTQQGGAAVDLKTEGDTGLALKAAAGIGTSLEQRTTVTRDDKGLAVGKEHLLVATLATSLSGSLGLKVVEKSIPFFSGSQEVSGGLTLSLTYNRQQDDLGGSLGAKLARKTSFSAFVGMRHMLPPGSERALAKVDELMQSGQQGTVEVEASYEVDLKPIMGALDAYFRDPESVTAEGVWERVATHVDGGATAKGKVVTTLTAGERLVGVKAEGGGARGGSVEASLDRGKRWTYPSDL